MANVYSSTHHPGSANKIGGAQYSHARTNTHTHTHNITTTRHAGVWGKNIVKITMESSVCVCVCERDLLNTCCLMNGRAPHTHKRHPRSHSQYETSEMTLNEVYAASLVSRVAGIHTILYPQQTSIPCEMPTSVWIMHRKPQFAVVVRHRAIWCGSLKFSQAILKWWNHSTPQRARCTNLM